MKLGSDRIKKKTPFRMFSLTFLEFNYTRGKIFKRNNDASTDIVCIHRFTLFHLTTSRAPTKEVV